MVSPYGKLLLTISVKKGRYDENKYNHISVTSMSRNDFKCKGKHDEYL